MKTVESIAAVREWRRRLGGRVGLVPTMGALHEGHLSLVRRARAECDHVAASLFVNPTQFGPREDLARYPRDLPRDRRLLEETGCDLLEAREVGLLEEPLHGAANRVHIIAGRAVGTPRADEREVIAAAFFAPDALPPDMPAALRRGLPGWITAATAADRPRAAAAPAPPPAPTA